MGGRLEPDVMRLPVPFAAFALVTLAFAGCLEETASDKDADSDVPPKAEYSIPELPKVDAKVLLENHKKFVSAHPYRAFNSVGHKGAREAIAKEFEGAGLVLWRQSFTAGNLPQENVCAVKIGAVEPTTWVVMGAHYDTTTWDAIPAGDNAPGKLVSQGAYDDGSGTWLVIETAKAYAKIDSAYSIVFCAFDGEERGLQGSRAVKRAMGDGGDFPFEVNRTRAMLDLDMFGINWPVRSPIFVTQNNPELLGKIDAQRKLMKIPDDMFRTRPTLPTLGSSDYATWIGDTPTVFFISEWFECAVPTPVPNPAPVPGVPCSYPFWHWMDTVETMTAMAGGPDMSRAGFQTALDLSVATLGFMALDPGFAFEPPAKA